MKRGIMAGWIVVLALGLCVLCTGVEGFACGIEGSAMRTDGSKVDGTVRVSTSWNSSEAFPRNGYYTLELGSSACGESVNVYVNGYDIGRYGIPNNGNARVNVTIKGTSDVPVR